MRQFNAFVLQVNIQLFAFIAYIIQEYTVQQNTATYTTIKRSVR